MKRTTMLTAALVVLVAATAAAWMPLGPRNHGPDAVTIQFDGTLHELTEKLRQEHDVNVLGVGLVEDVHVSLDLRAVTPEEVVAAVCREVGCVYERIGFDGRAFMLREGDWDADPRPQATAGDYRLYVHRVGLEDSSTIDFQWGQDEPVRTKTHRLTVSVSAQARDQGGAGQVFGLSGGAEVTTDAGETLARTGDQRSIVQEFGTHPVRLSFPRPTREAETIDFHGKLALFSRVVALDASWSPDEVGETRASDGLHWRLTRWGMEDGGIRVAIEADVAHRPASTDHVRATLVGPEDEIELGAPGAATSPDHVQLRWRVDAPQWQPQKLVVSGHVGLEPLRYVEFTIEGIPLPGN